MECSEKMWNMLSVPHCMPLAFSSLSIYLGSENRGSRFTTSSRFALEHGWTGVLKNALMGRWDKVSATEGRKDTVE